ncbi:uncharacterized protein A4U43_C08F31050 [Asparagus officinalis]|uniref:uncharacterized protein LOC109819771 n=1 Tax=Asparagus officinalis TaxID=4686 RepID=UPI00098DFF49|nr:uncharacterized protein LOC109819771 [Asparagus officinalis]ONK61543.1 uncharacterized protein A4U43_C08F31050 [Asparagus officinalis]
MSALLRNRRRLFFKKVPLFCQIQTRLLSNPQNQNPDPKSNLSARLSFVFDQIDAIDNRTSEKFDALQRIRQWREGRTQRTPSEKDPDPNKEESKVPDENLFVKKKDVEVVHPWPEWIELMERLGQQNYFDHRRRPSEEIVAESVGIDLSEVKEEVGFDFSRDWNTVRNACMNFGKDRFDILRSLSKKDIQILVGHGCPSMDPKVVFSSKLLRKYTHLDEGDVCSSCSLRNSCSRGYILTLKEDEARTLDVMRVLLTYGFDHVNGAVENKPLMQMKSVKTVVRKLLHEIVKLSAIPIDPNLPPPVIKKPPPKVKQPPPPPKKRVGRDDVEMKKGDWLCSKCDFMNFAKNTVCLQCDAKRPKRQLLPGEWECPQCNFLNYRRNMACFHCDAKRPPDEFTENHFQPKQHGLRMQVDRASRAQEVSNAWNFDFDDNESDGADVAAFEFADSNKVGRGSDLDERFEDDMRTSKKLPRNQGRGRYFSDDNERKSTLPSDRMGFDDFDDEEEDGVDSYELDGSNSQARDVSMRNFSEVEDASDSEDFDDLDHRTNFVQGAKGYTSGSEDDDLADHPQLKSSHVAESWRKSKRRGGRALGSDYDDDDDDVMDEDFGSKKRENNRHSSSRNGIGRHGGDSDSDDGVDSDSDGDDGNSYSGNKMRENTFRKPNDFGKENRRNKNNRRNDDSDDGLLLDSDSESNSFSGRNKMRGNSFRKSNDVGNARRGGFRSDDRRNNNNRRNSFNDHNDDFSSRVSHRGSYGGRRENGRFQRFDRTNDGNRRNGYSGRRENENFDSTNDRNRRNGYGGRRENDRFQSFDRFENGNRRERSNQFSDRSRGPRRDEIGSRGNGFNSRR